MIEAARQLVFGDRRRLLGDVLRAYAALQPGDATAQARLAEMLGFGFRQPTQAKAAPLPQQPRRDADVPPPDRRPTQPAEAEGTVTREPSDPRAITPESPPAGIRPPMAGDHPFKLRALRAAAPPRAARLALFSPRLQRALLSGLLARRSRTGAIDIDAVVATVASAQPIKSLPRLVRWSIRQPIEVLVDMGDGMQPFRRDQVQLLNILRRVLGAHRLRVGTFHDFPQSGVRMGRGPTRRFMPIPAGSILLLAAPGEDLSLDPRGAVEMWRSFLQELKAAGCDATILSPIATVAHERQLGRLAALVSWDRATGLGAVRDARRARGRR